MPNDIKLNIKNKIIVDINKVYDSKEMLSKVFQLVQRNISQNDGLIFTFDQNTSQVVIVFVDRLEIDKILNTQESDSKEDVTLL